MTAFDFQQLWEAAEFTKPCYMCGAELEPVEIRPGMIIEGSPYLFSCPDCGGQSRGWFAADGTEYNEWVDDLDGRPPWHPEYGKDPGYAEAAAAGRVWVPVAPPPRSEWSVPTGTEPEMTAPWLAAWRASLRPITDWPEGPARDAEALVRPYRETEWMQTVVEKGNDPEPCAYCEGETRPFSEWAAGTACSVCGGTWFRAPGYPDGGERP